MQNKRTLFIEPQLCNGCRLCACICSEQNTGGYGKEESSNFRILEIGEKGVFEAMVAFDPVSCGRCMSKGGGKLPCVRVCPTGAIIYGALDEISALRTQYFLTKDENLEFRFRAPWHRTTAKGGC